MTVIPKIPRHVRFYKETGDDAPKCNGEAWLLDDGTLDVTGIAVSIAGTSRSRINGPEWFMTFYGAWSNGYVSSRAVKD